MKCKRTQLRLSQSSYLQTFLSPRLNPKSKQRRISLPFNTCWRFVAKLQLTIDPELQTDPYRKKIEHTASSDKLPKSIFLPDFYNRVGWSATSAKKLRYSQCCSRLEMFPELPMRHSTILDPPFLCRIARNSVAEWIHRSKSSSSSLTSSPFPNSQTQSQMVLWPKIDQEGLSEKDKTPKSLRAIITFSSGSSIITMPLAVNSNP